jgi:monoterpene epsilon-lactone hydrolase
MASAQAEAIKFLYRGWIEAMSANPEMSLEETRALFDHWGDITAEPRGVDYVEVDAGGIPAMWAIPKGCSDNRVVMCTHGGGYVTGSMYTHRKLFGHLAKEIGCKALILDYRRAPEATHPAQVEDALIGYRWLLDQGYSSEHTCTSGDSAGGALCTSVLLAIREAGLPLPAGTMAMSPWYDPEAGKDALVSRDVLMGMSAIFLGEASAKDPLANLLEADLSGLSPIYIQTGGDEALLDDSVRFEQRAKDAGVDVTLDIYPEMQHVFHFMAGNAPEADDAIGKLAAWIKPKLGL